jgi:hypothetical protein
MTDSWQIDDRQKKHNLGGFISSMVQQLGGLTIRCMEAALIEKIQSHWPRSNTRPGSVWKGSIGKVMPFKRVPLFSQRCLSMLSMCCLCAVSVLSGCNLNAHVCVSLRIAHVDLQWSISWKTPIVTWIYGLKGNDNRNAGGKSGQK